MKTTRFKVLIFLAVATAIFGLIYLGTYTLMHVPLWETPPDFAPMNDADWIVLECYSANYQKTDGTCLGQIPGGWFCRLYRLEGLDENDYLYCDGPDGGSMFPVGPVTGDNLMMNPNSEEPILCLPLKNLTFTTSDKTVVTEDPQVLAAMVALRKTGRAEKLGDDVPYITYNATFTFDVPCELTYTCSITVKDDGRIEWRYMDEKTWNDEYVCDVTPVLKDLV